MAGFGLQICYSSNVTRAEIKNRNIVKLGLKKLDARKIAHYSNAYNMRLIFK